MQSPGNLPQHPYFAAPSSRIFTRLFFDADLPPHLAQQLLFPPQLVFPQPQLPPTTCHPTLPSTPADLRALEARTPTVSTSHPARLLDFHCHFDPELLYRYLPFSLPTVLCITPPPWRISPLPTTAERSPISRSRRPPSLPNQHHQPSQLFLPECHRRTPLRLRL